MRWFFPQGVAGKDDSLFFSVFELYIFIDSE
jgi:hypothetical protein